MLFTIMKNDELIDYILDLDYQFVMLLDYMMLIANSSLTADQTLLMMLQAQ